MFLHAPSKAETNAKAGLNALSLVMKGESLLAGNDTGGFFLVSIIRIEIDVESENRPDDPPVHVVCMACLA